MDIVPIIVCCVQDYVPGLQHQDDVMKNCVSNVILHQSLLSHKLCAST